MIDIDAFKINFSHQDIEAALRKLFSNGSIELRKGMNLSIAEKLGSGCFSSTFKGISKCITVSNSILILLFRRVLTELCKKIVRFESKICSN